MSDGRSEKVDVREVAASWDRDALRRRLASLRIEVVDEALAAILRRKTPAEKIAMVQAANWTARALLAGQIRRHHPDWDEAEVRREVARRMAGGTT